MGFPFLCVLFPLLGSFLSFLLQAVLIFFVCLIRLSSPHYLAVFSTSSTVFCCFPASHISFSTLLSELNFLRSLNTCPYSHIQAVCGYSTHRLSPNATSWSILLPQLSLLNCSISGPLLILLRQHWLLGSAFHTWMFCPLLSRFIPLNSGCLMEVPNLCAWSSLPPSVVSGKRRASSKSALDQEGPNWSQKYPWLSTDCQGSFGWLYSWPGCLRSVIVTSVQSLQLVHVFSILISF